MKTDQQDSGTRGSTAQQPGNDNDVDKQREQATQAKGVVDEQVEST